MTARQAAMATRAVDNQLGADPGRRAPRSSGTRPCSSESRTAVVMALVLSPITPSGPAARMPHRPGRRHLHPCALNSTAHHGRRGPTRGGVRPFEAHPTARSHRDGPGSSRSTRPAQTDRRGSRDPQCTDRETGVDRPERLARCRGSDAAIRSRREIPVLRLARGRLHCSHRHAASWSTRMLARGLSSHQGPWSRATGRCSAERVVLAPMQWLGAGGRTSGATRTLVLRHPSRRTLLQRRRCRQR